MKQQQKAQQEQQIQKKEIASYSKPDVLVLENRHPFLKAQNIIGNHGLLNCSNGVIQTKLKVGQPNDKYEQEADRVAEQVMRMSDADVVQRVESGAVQPMRIQRMCAGCEEEEMIQAKESPGQTPQVTSNLESKINTLKDGGQPLDSATRSFFEPRFGYDFSQVRVHSGNAAADYAKSINARAFTLGNHVVMGAGEYQPQSREGKQLLGHELMHTIQQSAGNIIRQIPADDPDQEQSWFDPLAPNSHIGSIYFPTASSEFDPDDYDIVEEIYLVIESFASIQPVMLTFEGYADTRGGEETNQTLSKARAKTVAGYFTPLYDEYPWYDQVDIGFGEMQSADSRLARRVDIQVEPVLNVQPPSPIPWAERVNNATSDKDKLLLINEVAMKPGNASLYVDLKLPVELIPSGSITVKKDRLGGSKDIDLGACNRRPYGVYFDPALQDHGRRLDHVECSALGESETGKSYLVVGPDILDVKSEDAIARTIYHEYVHIEQKEGKIHKSLLKSYQNKGQHIQHYIKEALAHSEDFKVFFGKLNYDSAGPKDQPALDSLLRIDTVYWNSLRTADSARNKVTDNIAGVATTTNEKTILRSMLSKLAGGSGYTLRNEVLPKI
ncbi:MAG: DUF4157 domain-containing protein [Bacteroidales bacterium]|nr:DUF4157 domain-containing protein [Bacteroidales bacterium]